MSGKAKRMKGEDKWEKGSIIRIKDKQNMEAGRGEREQNNNLK